MSSESREAEVARRLGDHYELLGPIGKGGFSSVFRVRNRRLDRVEALKVLSEVLTEDSDFARRFEQEARVAASLDHPNIVKVYDFSAAPDFTWFSMQFIDGPSLGKLMKEKGRLDELAAAGIARGVLDALEYSHARGVIHRDIKPDNILLDRRDRPYLTDFGVAKSAVALVKTQAGTLLGSPAYMSPEQLQGKPLDGRSDLYSVGITLYKALAGAFPFAADDTFRATMRRITEPPEPLSKRRPDVSPALEVIVMKALGRTPEERFSTAREMRLAIEDFLAEVTPPRLKTGVSPPAPPDRATPTQVIKRPAVATAPVIPPAEPPRRPPAEVSPVLPEPPPVPAPARGRTGPRILAAAFLLVIAAGLLWLRNRAATGPSPAPGPAPTPPALAKTAAPTSAPPTPVPTAAPSPEPTPAPTASPTSPPAAPTSPPARKPTRPAPRTTAESMGPFLPKAAAPTAAPPRASTPPPMVGPPRTAKTPPKLVSESPLILPAELRRAYANGSVGLLVTVAADGSVKDALVVSELCAPCDRAALEAVRHYRFQPALDASGQPVEARIALALRF